ncbi:MAG: NAD(P)H-binding protein [Cyclobacteriaceae bacterium]
MKDQTYLVIGGKGKTGRKVVEKLTSLGKEVRSASRSTNPGFDWEDPTTYAGVLEGVDAVYITFQPDLAIPPAEKAIKLFVHEAAKYEVKNLVLLSGRGEEGAEKCEEIVMNSGIDWTIVRADWFSQNFSENFFLESILAGQVALPMHETPVAYVDTDDISDVVVASLLDSKHVGQIYTLTGPTMLKFDEVINEIADATGRNIQFNPVSLEQYLDMMREHNIPEDFLWLVEYLFGQVLDGRNVSTTNDIEKVLGRKAKEFSEYVKETAATGVWNQTVPQVNA